jgi:hypothetical protein
MQYVRTACAFFYCLVSELIYDPGYTLTREFYVLTTGHCLSVLAPAASATYPRVPACVTVSVLPPVPSVREKERGARRNTPTAIENLHTYVDVIVTCHSGCAHCSDVLGSYHSTYYRYVPQLADEMYGLQMGSRESAHERGSY